jgi:Ca2+-binding EF-hand superfamily protein
MAVASLGSSLNLQDQAAAQQATAQAPAPPPASAVLPSQPPLPSEGATLERYFARLRTDFAQLDADRDGKITQRDVDLHTLMEAAYRRAYALFSVMRFDLDGDGTVTEDEIRRAAGYDLRSGPSAPEKKIEDTVRSIMALDVDKDDKVSVAEAGKFTPPELRYLGSPEAAERTRQALTSMSGTKGEITGQDYEAAGEALFRKVDADGDGKISPQEVEDYRRTLAVSAPQSDQPK